MTSKKVMIPAHVIPFIQKLLEGDGKAISLFYEGIASSRRNAQNWVKAYKENNYTTFTSYGHTYTQPDDYDPATALQDMVRSQQNVFSNLWRDLKENGEEVALSLTTDWHLPDHNPVALELCRLVTQAWFSGEDNVLHLNAGDMWDFPTISRHQNNVPFWLLYPGCSSPGDYMMLTMHAFEEEMKAWADVGPTVMITGNHDVRFIRHVFQAAPLVAAWGIQQFVEQVARTGLTWMGNGFGKIVFRDHMDMAGIEILHGEFARKGAGNSIRAQAEADGMVYGTYIQGHVHRVGQWTRSRANGPHLQGYEVGCIQNIQPLYSDRTTDWQNGMLLMRFNPHNDNLPEIHNLLFSQRKYGSKWYLTAQLEGNEFKVRVPNKLFFNHRMRRGMFDESNAALVMD